MPGGDQNRDQADQVDERGRRPENGIENCGLKKVETAGPMIAADMITAPVSPTALRRNRAPG